jgi:predicted nucleic acid-binding protein
MTVLLDTNIMLDALQNRHPFGAAAKEILLRAQNGAFECRLTANAAADIFYICKKARDANFARSALHFLLSAYSVVSVTHEDCLNALSLPMDDFEDALVVVCAVKAKADCIITRDEKFLGVKSPVKTLAPEVFLSKYFHTER